MRRSRSETVIGPVLTINVASPLLIAGEYGAVLPSGGTDRAGR